MYIVSSILTFVKSSSLVANIQKCCYISAEKSSALARRTHRVSVRNDSNDSHEDAVTIDIFVRVGRRAKTRKTPNFLRCNQIFKIAVLRHKSNVSWSYECECSSVRQSWSKTCFCLLKGNHLFFKMSDIKNKPPKLLEALGGSE